MTEEPISTTYKVFTPTIQKGQVIRNRRTLMAFSLAGADLLAIILSWVLAFVLRFSLSGHGLPSTFGEYMLLLPFSLLVYALSGLYNPNLAAVEEFRRLCKSTSIYFVVAVAFLYLIKEGNLISRLAIILAWVLSLGLVPLLREIIRTVLVRFGQWGEPVVIFGNGRLGNEVAAYLRSNPKMGYNPVGVVDRRKVERDPCGQKHVIHDAAVFTSGVTLPEWLNGVRTAFVVTPETSQNVHEMLIDKQTIRFEQLIMVSSGAKNGSLWVQPIDIGGILGLEVGQNLLNQSQLTIKRVMDIGLIILALPVLIPLFLIVAACIKIDSEGSVFYHQDRIGYGGKKFKLWKFRSMHVGAEEVLEKYLDANPERKAEYEQNHKLMNDPRVTRVGRVIRKLSIDELPQLINVWRGEMSLVGPRPFMGNEIGFYDKCYSLYTYVLPGVTGLWQISGRSNVTYETRVSLDDYYLRNWSIWLDIHILIRTVLVVLRGRGSY